MKFDSIVFDLDGTLWDTCATCAIAWNNVAQRNQIKFRDVTAADVRSVTGKPHADCIRSVFTGVPETQLQILIKETEAEDNLMIAKLGGQLYDGVLAGLEKLAAKYPLFIVSNCQSGYIEMFFEFSKAGSYFRDFECWGNTGRSKSENLRSLMERNDLRSPVMVGDTDGDEKAAAHCDIPFWFVTYGFGRATQFARSFDSFAELTRSLI